MTFGETGKQFHIREQQKGVNAITILYDETYENELNFDHVVRGFAAEAFEFRL